MKMRMGDIIIPSILLPVKEFRVVVVTPFLSWLSSSVFRMFREAS